MNEIVKVSYSSDKPTVSGRELHEALEVKTPYTQWFDRMTEYGFSENADYALVSQKCETNNPKNPCTTRNDHQISIDMAKQICIMTERKSKVWDATRVNTRCAYEAWCLDIVDLEARFDKISKLERKATA